MMDVKAAVATAMNYVADLFQAENVTNLGLEEVQYDDSSNAWDVTVGFSRPWDYPQDAGMNIFHPQPPKRQYKIVSVNNLTGQVVSVKNRE